MLPSSRPFSQVVVRVSTTQEQLLASYYLGCGLFIAASFRPSIVNLCEEKHPCPESRAVR